MEAIRLYEAAAWRRFVRCGVWVLTQKLKETHVHNHH